MKVDFNKDEIEEVFAFWVKEKLSNYKQEVDLGDIMVKDDGHIMAWIYTVNKDDVEGGE